MGPGAGGRGSLIPSPGFAKLFQTIISDTCLSNQISSCEQTNIIQNYSQMKNTAVEKGARRAVNRKFRKPA